MLYDDNGDYDVKTLELKQLSYHGQVSKSRKSSQSDFMESRHALKRLEAVTDFLI